MGFRDMCACVPAQHDLGVRSGIFNGVVHPAAVVWWAGGIWVGCIGELAYHPVRGDVGRHRPQSEMPGIGYGR